MSREAGGAARPYLDLARTPGLVRIISSQLVARLPLGLLSLAILMHVESLTGSYATAGGVVAALSLGEAAIVPITSRLAGVVGARRLLVMAAAANAVALSLLATAVPNPVLLVALGAFVGVTVPPLMPVVRALYPRLANPPSLPALFALDTTAQELIWIIGPVIAALLASTAGPAAPLLLCAAITLLGTFLFVTSPTLKGLRLERPAGRPGGILRSRALLISMMTSSLLVGSFMALEVGIVARFQHDGVIAGLAIAVSSLGSLVGGLTLGHRNLGLCGTIAMLGICALGTGLTVLTQEPVGLSLALFLSGLGFAPALAALYLMISRSVSADTAAEAFGWLSTSNLVGAALGTAVAGTVSEMWGSDGSILLATCIAAVAALTPAVARLSGPLPGLTPER